MSEITEEIAELAEKLTAYGTGRGAGTTEEVLRVLLCDGVIAVTADLGAGNRA